MEMVGLGSTCHQGTSIDYEIARALRYLDHIRESITRNQFPVPTTPTLSLQRTDAGEKTLDFGDCCCCRQGRTRRGRQRPWNRGIAAIKDRNASRRSRQHQFPLLDRSSRPFTRSLLNRPVGTRDDTTAVAGRECPRFMDRLTGCIVACGRVIEA